MMFGHLLSNTSQIFSDVRTYWSADAVRRVTGHKLTGAAAGGFLLGGLFLLLMALPTMGLLLGPQP